MSKTYLIAYTCYDSGGNIIIKGKMRVKNQQSRFMAQCHFEEYLKKKYKSFGKLIITSCNEDTPMYAGDFMKMFNDIVGFPYDK